MSLILLGRGLREKFVVVSEVVGFVVGPSFVGLVFGLNPSNILLDHDLVARVGDFGLPKILQSEYQNRHNSSSAGVRCTIGFATPGLSLQNYAKEAMDDGGHGIVDPVLLNDDGKLAPSTNKEGTEETTGYMNNKICLCLLLEIGVSCSRESPTLQNGHAQCCPKAAIDKRCNFKK
nr:probable LRR receptor-like serine/threonine-protein kinase At3g47570 [Tanacetum cinerariifolium]